MRKLRRLLSVFNPLRALAPGLLALRNRWRLRVGKIDYITLTLPTDMPALPEARSWLQRRVLGPPPLSLMDIDRIFERIGDDPRPKGIILHLRGWSLSFADLQTLRASITRLRGRGKRVICFAQSYSNALYYLASAADEIVLQPGGELETVGLRAAAIFLKDALDRIGVQLDSVAISPYKGAYDQFTRRDISPEGREQLEWLLDSRFDLLVNGIAEGRRLSPDAVRALIDGAPYLDEAALQAGYVDAVLTEEDLHRKLDAKHVLPWHSAAKRLIRRWRPPQEQYVAILRVAGLMMPGESGKLPVDIPLPFVGSERAGDLTVVQQVRALMKNKRAAAVVLFIDSGGGAAVTAEAMTSALAELAKDRPLVVCMNGVAASGGYMIATPARWIVAQPGSITGSIGVLSGKLVTSDLRQKLNVNQVEFLRGANAGWLSDSLPFSDEQRARAMQTIRHIYRRFLEKVAQSRNLALEAVDSVGGGRVWTGAQALERGLVDELGDLYAAIAKARQLAGLPADAPYAIVRGRGKPLAAQLAEQANPTSTLNYLHANLRALHNTALLLLPFTLDETPL